MLEKILYADSGAGQTQEMLQALIDLPAIRKASITILRVVPPQITTEALASKWEEGTQMLTKSCKKSKLNRAKFPRFCVKEIPKIPSVKLPTKSVQT